MKKHFYPALWTLTAILLSSISHAQVLISSATTAYTQNFNALKTSGSSSLPTGWRLFESGSSANSRYSADAGNSGTGDTYSYGTGANTDRALGGLLSSSLKPTIGVQIKNTTGKTITSITVSYTGEQWRCGAAGRNDQLDFQYSLNATSLSNGTWVDNNSLDFISPNTVSTGSKDGNAAGNRTNITATITGLSIANNGVFWFRWNDFNASGADDGLAIDDVSVLLNAGDVAPPAVSSLTPANGATNISLSGNLSITFNENIQKGAGAVTIKKLSDGTAVQTTDVSNAGVTISNATASFPYSGLSYGTSYYAEVSNGAFKDLAGNNFEGISGSSTWLFTTLPPPAPTVSVNPSALSFANTTTGTISSSQSFNLTTGNVSSALTLTAPPGFELSRDNNSFASSISYTSAEAASAQTVYVHFAPVAAQVYSGTINFNTTGLNTNAESLSGTGIAPLPTINVAPASLDFGNVNTGTISAPQLFSLTTTNITGTLTLTAPAGFELSRDNISSASTISYTSAETAVAQTVYVRFVPTAVQAYSGAINFNATGLNTNAESLSGTGTTTAISADTLKVVNWNIAWFGSNFSGPADKNLQEANVLTVMQNLNADVYALAEVVDVTRLANVVNAMPGYSFIVSDFCSGGASVSSCASAQKLAYVYRTSKVNKIRSYGMLKAGGSANAYYNWASGRFPYVMEADVTINNATTRILFTVLHAKANTGTTAEKITSYNRRRDGIAEARDSFNVQYPNSNFMITGDYNDDLDKTIVTQLLPDTTSSYSPILTQPDKYVPVTLPLSLAGQSSMATYPDAIDHVTLSNEMNNYYVANSAKFLKAEVESLIANYATTTSDHYPVQTKYFFNTSSAAPAFTRAVSPVKMNTITGANRFGIRAVNNNGTLSIYITDIASAKTNLQLMDMNGRVLQQKQFNTTTGTIRQDINTNRLAAGIFLVKVNNAHGSVLQKVLLSR